MYAELERGPVRERTTSIRRVAGAIRCRRARRRHRRAARRRRSARPQQAFLRFGAPVIGVVVFLLVWQIARRRVRHPAVSCCPRRGTSSSTSPATPASTSATGGSRCGRRSSASSRRARAGARSPAPSWRTRRSSSGPSMPLAVLIQVTPIIAYAPAIVVWLGFGLKPILVITSLVCFVPFLVNSVAGLRSVDPNLLELARSVDARKRVVFWRLRLPSALPFLFSAARIAVGLALIGAVLGEFFAGTPAGLGYAVKIAQARPIQLHRPAVGQHLRARLHRRHGDAADQRARALRAALAQLATSLSHPACHHLVPPIHASTQHRPPQAPTPPQEQPMHQRAPCTIQHSTAQRRVVGLHGGRRWRSGSSPPSCSSDDDAGDTTDATADSTATERDTASTARRHRPTARPTRPPAPMRPSTPAAATSHCSPASTPSAAPRTRPPARSPTCRASTSPPRPRSSTSSSPKESGYFDDLCLDVDLKPSFSTANYPLVASDEAQFSSAGNYTEILNNTGDGAEFVAFIDYGKAPIEALVTPEGGATELAAAQGQDDRREGRHPAVDRGDARQRRPGPRHRLQGGAARRLRPAGPPRHRHRRAAGVQVERAGAARRRRREVQPVRSGRRRHPRARSVCSTRRRGSPTTTRRRPRTSPGPR